MMNYVGAPIGVSNRVGTDTAGDLFVEHILERDRLVIFRNIKTGDSEIIGFDVVYEQMMLGRMRITARRQIAKRTLDTTMCNIAKHRLNFCIGIDEADARFMISRARCVPIIERVAMRLHVSPPSYEEVMKWWRAWAFADRNSAVLEENKWEVDYAA
ncbi:hypothetical protein [Ahrensia sp. 13_GOM-1096m]|uniref:hypothetical protein n=1 Tax=Ahrensia sp. 13_GOM-1096m TaxID=1380380 RepID=UPI0004798CF5|nr:hypothetical protein [Ahrensia sp. 13_GOM-1096m]